MKFFLNHRTGRCVRCQKATGEHVWQCSACGTPAEAETCSCGDMHAPKLVCSCGYIGLYCPEPVRVVTREVLDALEEERAFMEQMIGAGDTRGAYRWEMDEAKRLFAKSAS